MSKKLEDYELVWVGHYSGFPIVMTRGHYTHHNASNNAKGLETYSRDSSGIEHALGHLRWIGIDSSNVNSSPVGYPINALQNATTAAETDVVELLLKMQPKVWLKFQFLNKKYDNSIDYANDQLKIYGNILSSEAGIKDCFLERKKTQSKTIIKLLEDYIRNGLNPPDDVPKTARDLEVYNSIMGIDHVAEPVVELIGVENPVVDPVELSGRDGDGGGLD